MKSISLDSCPRRAASISFKEVEDEGILLNLKDGSYYGVNETGIFLWQHLDGHATLGDIAAEMTSQFDVSLQRSHQDILEWTEKLSKARLLDWGPKKS